MRTTLENADMAVHQLGNSDLFTTSVGFGAWAIGGSGWKFGWGERDDQTSIATIHRALSLVLNSIRHGSVLRNGPL